MPPIALPAVAEDSLLLAIIHSSVVPLVLLDDKFVVIAASDTFSRVFALDPALVEGRKLLALGAGEWNVPQLENLLNATAGGHAAIDAYEMDLKRKGHPTRRLVINARTLDHPDAAKIHLMLTIMDVTDARKSEKLKDNLLREKGILLQELQHRVANSLQIIASVLMQNAKRTQSEEARTNLHDAHLRIMSVAQLQQQLAASRLGDVNLHAYFTDLCRTIGASMIHDHDQVKIEVSADDSVTNAENSISLGLMITELVINAIKYGFPGEKVGTINVDYRSHGKDWTLTVADDGIGLPKGRDAYKPGLGTNIVEALASSLDAKVKTTDAKPGVCVSIIHH